MQRLTRLEWSILKEARDAGPIHRQQLPVLARQNFLGFSRQFDAEIREAGAKTVLLMTWERPDSISAGVNTAKLASAYNSVGTELGALVAPARHMSSPSRAAQQLPEADADEASARYHVPDSLVAPLSSMPLASIVGSPHDDSG